MIGQRLRELRLSTTKTQEDVADELGIKRASYSHYENNRREPDLVTLVKIADYYRVSVDYILMRTSYPKMLVGERSPSDFDEAEVLRKIIERS